MDKNLLISTAVILLLSAFIGANFIYEPKVRQLKNLERILAEEKELGSLLDEIATAEKRIGNYETRLMEKGKEEAELLDRVRDIANEAAVPVISITPSGQRQGGRKGNEPQFISVRILFGGSYHQLGRFIARVESSEKFMRIESIRLTGQAGTPSKSLMPEVEISTLRH